ncbi:MAG: hypothetical protein ACLTBV_17135 [Enterocloster bolteae]
MGEMAVSISARNMPETVHGVQCCGLGGCAGGREPELARGMTDRVADQGHGTVFTYCASCARKSYAGRLPGVTHLLPEILGCDEKPDIGKSMVNRMLTKVLVMVWQDGKWRESYR